MASVPPGLAAGMTVAGKYELLRKIGCGAMGEVWAARHKTLGEEVAIKLVLRNVDNGDGSSAESRFLLEARVAASLSRKTRHIVAVTDHGQDGPLGYLVMELLHGESLDARIERTGPLPIVKVVPMIIQIARGLSIAHGDGVTHRDLKPSNVFVTIDEDGNAVAKVLDFGIAKLRRGDRKAAFATQRGFLLGTPAFMSPEQARGRPVDHRADVWALAVITYHMLTGELPFEADPGDELLARLIKVNPIPIHQRRPGLPPIVADFFARAFAKRVEDRFPSALSLASAFEQLEPLSVGLQVLSLPPPTSLAIMDDHVQLAGLTSRNAQPKHEQKTSPLFVAGLPPKRRLLSPTIAGIVVVAVLTVTGVLLSIYFEREPRNTAGGAAQTMPTSSAREIPAPPRPTAEPPLTTTDELPNASPRVSYRATPGVVAPSVVVPSVPPPSARGPITPRVSSAPTVSPPLKITQEADKSAIF